MWYRRGFGYFEEFNRLKLMQGLQPTRFMIRKDEKRDVVFLDGGDDDAPFMVVEHRKKVAGAWTYPVCQNSDKYLSGEAVDLQPCVACDENSGRHTVGMLSVIDIAGYERDKKKYPGLRRLFCADEACLRTLSEIRAQCPGGSLTGAVIRVNDTAGEWGSCGTSWELLKVLPKDKWDAAIKKMGFDVSKNPWQPFDYASFVKLVPNETMRSIWAGKVTVPDAGADEEVKY